MSANDKSVLLAALNLAGQVMRTRETREEALAVP